MTNGVNVRIEGLFLAKEANVNQGKSRVTLKLLSGNDDSFMVWVPDELVNNLPASMPDRYSPVILDVFASAYKDDRGNAQMSLRFAGFAPVEKKK